MPVFNQESRLAINAINQIGINESDLVSYSSSLDISCVSHFLVINYGFSGWAEIGYMVVGGFLFGFSGSKICWHYPVKKLENGKFSVYEFNEKTERAIESAICN